jgi:hypothetical protein
MDQDLVPLSEAKTHLHEIVRRLDRGDVVLVRHGRPVAAVIDFRRYRDLLSRAGRAGDASPRDPLAILRSGRDSEELAGILRARRVERLLTFGSAGRGELEPDSDIDLLVAFQPMNPAERSDALFGLQEDLERLLGRKVDLVEDEAVENPFVRETIDRDARVVYEAS